MAKIVIASDFKDKYVATQLPKILRGAGHSIEEVYPLEKIIVALREMSLALTGADLGILVHSTSDSTGTDSPYRIVNQLREIPEKFTFCNAVKAKALPLLVVYHDLGPHQVELEKLKHTAWVETYDLDDPAQPLLETVKALIFRWRTDLLRDLECVGYAITIGPRGGLKIDPAFVKKEIEGSIIARGSSLKWLRRAKYVIVDSDWCRDVECYRRLAHLIDNFRVEAKQKKTKPEEIFQEFFAKNPHLLFPEPFAEVFTKPRLLYPDNPSRWFEPDFVVKPAVAPHIGPKWKVLDLKLPGVSLAQGQRFHPTFSGKLFSALRQVAKYRHYFNRPDAAPYLIKELGFQPLNPKLAVLIGTEQSDEVSKILANSFADLQMPNIEIITYDEVRETQWLRLQEQLIWLRQLT